MWKCDLVFLTLTIESFKLFHINTLKIFLLFIFTEIISLNIPHTLIHDSTFIGSFCYGIMSQAIRSEVDKQIISLCCRVLLNLARYKPTQQNVFQVSRK